MPPTATSTLLAITWPTACCPAVNDWWQFQLWHLHRNLSTLHTPRIGQNPLRQFPRSKSVTSWRLPRNKSTRIRQHKRQVRNKSVTNKLARAKVSCVCCVVSFHKFYYNDLLPLVGNFPVYAKTCVMDFGQWTYLSRSIHLFVSLSTLYGRLSAWSAIAMYFDLSEKCCHLVTAHTVLKLSSPGVLSHIFYRDFRSACAVTFVIFGHLNRSFTASARRSLLHIRPPSARQQFCLQFLIRSTLLVVFFIIWVERLTKLILAYVILYKLLKS